MSLDLDAIRVRIESQRPLHWSLAARLVRELEALRNENEALRSAHASSVAPASDGAGCDQPFSHAPDARLDDDSNFPSARTGEPFSPRDLAVQLAQIDLDRIGRGEKTLVDVVVHRPARVIAAGLQGNGLVTDVIAALEALVDFGAVEREFSPSVVCKTRPQRYRWASVTPSIDIRRFIDSAVGAS